MIPWPAAMHPLRKTLNKIFWDKRERIDDYILTFIHRGSPGDTRTIPLTKIVKVGSSSFTYQDDSEEETTIPFHRVTLVKNTRSDKALWQKRGITR